MNTSFDLRYLRVANQRCEYIIRLTVFTSFEFLGIRAVALLSEPVSGRDSDVVHSAPGEACEKVVGVVRPVDSDGLFSRWSIWIVIQIVAGDGAGSVRPSVPADAELGGREVTGAQILRHCNLYDCNKEQWNDLVECKSRLYVSVMFCAVYITFL